jgi:hypothetical protein
MSIQHNNTWPRFNYDEFKATEHLLHMLIQVIGKLKLATPFEPEWSNVGLWITDRGISTGLIPNKDTCFCVVVDLIVHKVICTLLSGETFEFDLKSMSVAELTKTLLNGLKQLGIEVSINFKPQEVPHPILFNEDTEKSEYVPSLTNTWWRILVNIQRVMQRYHAKFRGKTPPIALMWGTLDIRDARFNGAPVVTTGVNAGYIRRNAMDEAQVECGWWGGNELYPHAAFYSFTHPEPEKIAEAKISPDAARWDKAMQEFILDYEDLSKADNPDEVLLSFFESTYQAGAERAHWDKNLIGTGKPV